LSAASEAREGEDDFEVEVEIMIAGACFQCVRLPMMPSYHSDEAFRRKGLVSETLFLLLTYTTGQWLTSSIPVLEIRKLPNLIFSITFGQLNFKSP